MASNDHFVSFQGQPSVNHILSLIDGEYTACGIAFDAASDEEWLGKQILATNRVVNCRQCAALIEHFRGVRVSSTYSRIDSNCEEYR